MNQKIIASTVILASMLLVAVLATTSYPKAFAQSESESETEQDTDQKNICSGFAVCTNDSCSGFEVCTNGAETNIDPSGEDARTLIATPH